MIQAPSDAGYESEGLLNDGSLLRLRALCPDDHERLRAMGERCSEDTLYKRFMSLPQITEENVDLLLDLDHERRMAICVVVGEGDHEEIVAVGRWAAQPGADRAEVAFTVEDAHQGQGIGTLLLKELADLAPRHGIRVFEAEVLGTNKSMLAVFGKSGYPVSDEIESGVFHVEFPIDRPRLSAEEIAAEKADAPESPGASAPAATPDA